MHPRIGSSLKWLILLLPLGLVGSLAAMRLCADHHFRAAKKELEQRNYAGAREHVRRCLPKSGEVLLAAQVAKQEN